MSQSRHTQGMLPAGTFADRTIVITGGGTGLGRSMSKYLLELGANLVICGRREAVIVETARELAGETGGQVLGRACDVRKPEEVEALADAAYERFGAVQGLVNNAAGNFICPTERLSYNAFNSVVDIVLKGSYNCTLAFGKRWIADKTPGAMLSISTTYAWTGSGYVVPSAVAKAGVLIMTRSLASEWGKYGIRLNAIAPGPFPTEGAWSRLMPPQLDKTFDPKVKIPLGRHGEHQELANLAAYLLSDFAAYITGDVVTIDGGEWLRGAGEFNGLEAVSQGEWDLLQAAMKPKK
ncbi:MAG: SDR family oxidoreductase [Pirellulales bacterium]|nr:SDR family oxidoreductase [Pirellulales bacterium]